MAAASNLDPDLCIACPNACRACRATGILDHFDEFDTKSGMRDYFFLVNLDLNRRIFSLAKSEGSG